MSRAAPASIAGIKRFAKLIAAEKSIKHTAALEEAAQLAGYQTFLHAKRALATVGTSPPQSTSAQTRRQTTMNYEDFHLKTRTAWTSAVNHLASGDRSMGWTRLDDIERTIVPFLGRNYSHAHLPTGGGFDFWSVKQSREPGGLEFAYSDRNVITVKPRGLIIERIDADPAESFVLLELDRLDTSGAYTEERNEGMRETGIEEVLEIDGRYYSRDGVDDGYYRDENGRERDLPERWRIVVRFLKGQILIVVKGSIWNGASGTYNGMHNTMGADQIRGAIERAIGKGN